MATIDDFSKLEIRIGTIISAERVPEADKLLKLIFDFGDEERQVMAGIAEAFDDPSVLVGKQVPVIVNLEPRVMRGYESQGMMLAAGGERPVLLHPAEDVAPGAQVR